MQVQSLASLGGLGIRHCHELWCRLQTGSDPALLWLWCMLTATAPIRPLAWEAPYAAGAALEMAKKDKKKKIECKCAKLGNRLLGFKSTVILGLYINH